MKRGWVLKGSTTAIALALCAPAYAQVNTIIVTAQKREENIQDVPIAITAFDEEQLQKQNAITFEEVARNVPGVQFENDVDIRTSRIRVRGISGGGGTAGTDTSVGVYVDEVYLGQAAAANTDIFDLERVEFLRGPQGTLFGRNTLAGVINMSSKRPTDTLSGFAQAEYGNFDHTRLKARISGPIVEDVLAVSVSGLYFNRDGFLQNETLGLDVNDQNSWGARAGLYFTPSSNFELEISGDYRKVDQRAKTYETLINDPASIPGAFGALLNDDPFDRVTFGDFEGEETLEAWGLSARARLSLDAFDIVSVTGYRAHDYFSDGESDLTPLGIGRNQDIQDVDRFTQELRLETTGSGPLSAIAGVFYLDQDSTNGSGVSLDEDLLNILPGLFGIPPVNATRLVGGAEGVTETKSYAIFGSLNYEISDSLAMTLGARQTWEDRTLVSFNQVDFEAEFGFPLLAASGSIPRTEDSYNAFTPTATISYTPAEDVLLYATVSRGFRSGGFNDSLGDLSGIAFGPETLWNYEGGVKAVWLDSKVRTNLAVFYMEWDDIQLTADDPTTPALFDPRTINAGRAVSQGIEFDGAVEITDTLTLSGNLAIVDATFKEGTLLDGTPLDRIPGAADYTFAIAADYVVPISDSADFKARVDYYRQGDVALDPNQTRPEAFQDSYGLLGARIGVEYNDAIEFSVWGKNLTNEDFNVGVFDLLGNPFVGQFFNALGPPRTYGVEVRYSF